MTFSRPLLSVLLVTGLPTFSAAQTTYPGCSDLQASEITKTELFSRTSVGGSTLVSTLAEPVSMSFNAVKSGDSVIGADIYLVQREGVVRKYDFLTKQVKQIGFVNNAEALEGGNGDNGLMGIALAPDFATTRNVYLWYIPPRVGSNYYRGRLSRFTLGAQDTLQLNTEKILLDIQLSKSRQWHAGGPMRFDAHGDLWLAIGNNGTDLSGSGSQYSTTDSSANQEWGASSTASMRGGVIRIHPDNSAKGYSIPVGNFGEYWADYFQGQGNAALAAQYRDTTKVLPEIYVKGTRSNHSIAVHPTKRWLAWGEVNYQTTNDEFNLVTTPAFTGFPYFHKNNVATPGTITPAKDTLAPTNTSIMNSGVTQLPPARGAVLWYGGGAVTATTLPTNVAMGGDMYAYDRNLKSGVKFPPHFHNMWLLMSKPSSSMYAVGLDSVTAKPTGAPVRIDNAVLGMPSTSASNAGSVRNPLQASFGPDGALYVLNYGGNDYGTNLNPGVVRLTYTGSCQLPPVSVRPDYRTNPDDIAVQMRRDGLFVREPGEHVMSLRDAAGRLLLQRTGSGETLYSFRELREKSGLESGVYVVSIRTARGNFVRQITLL